MGSEMCIRDSVDSAPYFAPVLDITARVTAKLNQAAQFGETGEEQ